MALLNKEIEKMKVVLTELPELADRDLYIERAVFPADAEIVMAVYDAKSDDNSAFYKELEDADVVVNGYLYLDKVAIDAMKKCQIISFQSTGYNEVDFDYATEKGIAVASIEDYCTEETAENAMALMLMLQRGLRIYDREIQQNHNWKYDLVPDMKRIRGQVMGIVGLGKIGRAVAKMAQGFRMEVIAYDPFLPAHMFEECGVKSVDMDEILEQSDVISIHMNLTGDNVHFFDKEKFAKCKKKPIIINEGRGAMISEEDLAWALDEGLVSAAGLDMLESETPDLSKCKLMGRDNVIITPHAGFYSTTSMDLLFQYSAENALNYYNKDFDKVASVRNGIFK